ncbi:MAG: hypothetical protein Q9175_001627 [Cornicularia normoerica]
MAWTNSQSWASSLMGPTPMAIGIAILLVLSIPLFLHLMIYRSTSSTTLPSFLLVGSSGAGKTALLTLFERGQHAETRTSQVPLSVEVSFPVSTKAASSKYRSVNDPSNQVHKKFLLADTPGHGKLRHHAFNSVIKPQNLKGIIFMVDAADISMGNSGTGNEALRQAAEYLHDMLLLLQKRATSSRTSKAPKELPVLIAANKLDLFTALPAPLVKMALESEISNVRRSRTKGLLDSGIGMNDLDIGEEKEWLGDGGDGKFEFSQMDGVKVAVSVTGGNVLGADGPDVEQWWNWIAREENIDYPFALHYNHFVKKVFLQASLRTTGTQPSTPRNNMFPNILCLTLYLPLLILAYPPSHRYINSPISAFARSTNPPPSVIHAPTGDTLNRTVCFCASRTWMMDQSYGFYYQISYYNAHLDHTYTLEPACQSRISINVQDKYDPKDKPILQNECLRSRFHDPVKYCTGKDTDENTFCYTLAGRADYDTWAFNGQHRTGLPLEPEVNYPRNVVEEVCEESCNEHVEGMEMLKEDALEILEGYYNLVGESLESSVVFYPSLPDMCKGCR